MRIELPLQRYFYIYLCLNRISLQTPVVSKCNGKIVCSMTKNKKGKDLWNIYGGA